MDSRRANRWVRAVRMIGVTTDAIDDLVDEPGPWDATRWWRLELRAWRQAPDVVLALSVLAPREAWSKEAPRPSSLGCVRGLAFLFSFVAPTLGAGIVLGWWQDGAQGGDLLRTAGLLVLAALGVTVYGEILDRRTPRASDRRSVRTVALLHVVPGLAALAIGGIAAAGGAIATPPAELLWLAPIVLDVAAHLVLWARGPVRPGGPRNRIENLDRSVAEAPREQREAVVRDLARGIERLRSSGRIDDALAERARRCAPGTLARTLAPEVGAPEVRAAGGRGA